MKTPKYFVIASKVWKGQFYVNAANRMANKYIGFIYIKIKQLAHSGFYTKV